MGTQIMARPESVLNMVARDHFIQLTRAIASKNAVVYNKTSRIKMEQVTAQVALDDGYMTVDDFTSYTNGYGIKVLVGARKVGHVKKFSLGETLPRQKRFDALAAEYDSILRENPSLTATQLMARLLANIGKPDTCILSNTGEGLQWDQGNSEPPKNISVRMLDNRIQRWKKKNKALA